MRRLLTSALLVVGIVGAVAWGTSSFFSDTETSTGNVFAAGGIDLKIDSTAHYNGMVCTEVSAGVFQWQPEDPEASPSSTQFPVAGEPCTGTFAFTDLTEETFFNYTDLKPGDFGENTISLHVLTNDAWACVDINNMQNDDNDLTTPEEEAGDSTGGEDEGEIAQNLFFTAWLDQGATPGFQGDGDATEGDNIWQEGSEPLLFENQFGPASDVLNGVTYPLADSTTGTGPIIGSDNPLDASYIGLAWCFGTMSLDGGVISCDGSSVTNEVQTDSLTADLSFRIVQARNNPDFVCEPPTSGSPTPTPSGSPSPEGEVGALLSAYDAPTCDVTVQPGNSVQAAIDGASAGQTICLADGTHDDDEFPLRLNKDNMTLAGQNGPTATATLAGGVIMDNDGTTVTGLVIGSSTALSETFGVYVNTGVNNAKVSYNVITGLGTSSGRGIVNATGTTTNAIYSNNVISNWLTGIYLNPSSGMLAEYNTVKDNGVGIANDNPSGNTLSRNIVKNNTAEGIGVLMNSGDSITVSSNNIYGNPASKDLVSYGSETVPAENNWWGDTDPSNNVTGQVDHDPAAGSAYPEN